MESCFLVPVGDRFLVYAPLHDLAALVDRRAAGQLRAALCDGADTSAALQPLITILAGPHAPAPTQRTGPLSPPFLGIITTRACNLACVYCGFWDGSSEIQQLSSARTRSAIDWYLAQLGTLGISHGAIHFFGGEPFAAPQVMEIAVYYAEAQAAALGLEVTFEVATNGTFDARRCRWVADHFAAVVLSLDGPQEIHDRHRPARGGKSSFAAAVRTATLLSDGPAKLCLRACVTEASAPHMESIADWFCAAFRPAAVCFEPLQPTCRATAAGLVPPEPIAFAQYFRRAERLLLSHGIEAVHTTADINSRRFTFCPVGQDGIIVGPDDSIASCYLLPEEWERQGLDLRLGRLSDSGEMRLDPAAVARVRAVPSVGAATCAHCFCRWHCAGGCHVNHRPPAQPGTYDRLCVQTRAITLSRLLDALGADDMETALFDDPRALAAAVYNPTDALDHTSADHLCPTPTAIVAS